MSARFSPFPSIPPALLLLAAFLAGPPAWAGMVDPSIDSGAGPFCFFSRPVTVIGAMDSPEGIEVTPEGFLYTGFAELIFFIGDPPQPLSNRINRLEKGYLPVVTYEVDHHGVRAAVKCFATTLDGRPEGRLVAFVRLSLENRSSRPQTRSVWAGIRYQPDDRDLVTGTPRSRFRRPLPETPGYRQAGEAFDYDWEYNMGEDFASRDGRIIYLFPPAAAGEPPVKYLSLDLPWDPTAFAESPIRNITPSTPVCLTRYRLTVPPGGVAAVDLKMPYFPVDLSEPEAVDSLRAADPERWLAEVRGWWDDYLGRGMGLDLPEPKVTETFKASLVYQLIARDKIGDDYIQRVNEFQYDAFFIDEAAMAVRSFDLAGQTETAEQSLWYLMGRQREDGNFISEPSRYHEFGTALWAICRHALISRDETYAARAYPVVQRAMRWLRSARRRDPRGLIPFAMSGNVEDIAGHVTGHNIWALAGADAACAMADFLGRRSDLKDFQSYRNALRKSFLSALKSASAAAGGGIPPGLDGEGGQDWGNMMAVWPAPVLETSNPLVGATIERAEARSAEGLMTYLDGEFLHHPLSVHLAGSYLALGRDRQALETFYSLLVHTSSAHAGFETGIPVWGDRDFGDNLSPNGAFHSRYIMLLRDMLVREVGDELVLMSVVSPAWIKPGERIAVSNAPTDFGPVSYTLEVQEGRGLFRIEPEFVAPPRRVVVRLPWFVEATRAVAEAQEVVIKDRRIELKPEDRRLVVDWTIKPEDMSYERAVADYREEYRRRFEDFLETGGE